MPSSTFTEPCMTPIGGEGAKAGPPSPPAVPDARRGPPQKVGPPPRHPCHETPVHTAATPKARIAAPETTFTALMPRGPTLPRRRLTAVLKSNHHKAEPKNTPPTSSTTEKASAFAPTPTAAKIAAKDRIVVGFVSVRKSVEA